MSKHTPEPWVIDKSKWIAAQWGTFEDQSRGEPNCAGDELPAIVSCRDPDGNDDHDLAIRPRRADQQNRRLAHAENVANLARICACVNALAGLNPAGVKGLVEAAENALNEFEERFELTSPTTNPGIKYTANELRTAIANLKGTQ